MGKGSNRRPGEGYEAGFERIFGGKDKFNRMIDDQIKQVEEMLRRRADRRQQDTPVEFDRRSGKDRRQA